MRLSEIATKDVIYLKPADSLDRAIQLMEQYCFHHLPVIQKGLAVGIVSDRDLLIAVGWMTEDSRKVEGDENTTAGPTRVDEVMTRPVLCLSPENEVHTAARVMAEKNIHAFPLERNGEIVGIVTSSDLLDAFAQGASSPRRAAALEAPVSACMRGDPVTVPSRDTLMNAANIMSEKGLHHLPVESNGKLVGIISARDIRRAFGRSLVNDEVAQANGEFYIGETGIADVMTKDVATIPEDATVREAIAGLRSLGIGCLPVLRGDTMAGIVTTTDLLLRLAEIDEAEASHRA